MCLNNLFDSNLITHDVPAAVAAECVDDAADAADDYGGSGGIVCLSAGAGSVSSGLSGGSPPVGTSFGSFFV